MHDEFTGVIGRDWRTSTPAWPARPEPPDGAPNVVYVVLDDVGYAQVGCYGSVIDTPNIDALAGQGVRLANFHTTALCSPTRSCLLTGRNHHTNGMGRVADLAMGFPGYWGVVPPENGFLSEILRTQGYSTYAVGKWHLTPDDETHMAADRSSWPIGRGFDRWYGFHGGETHQFVPTLYCDNHSVQPPRTPAEGYHLTEDLVDHAIEYLSDLRNADGEQPFFLYFATGACHSPHHAPPEWIERYRGVFDDGWDALRERILARQIELGILPPDIELSPRPPWVPAWDELEPEDQKVAARFMECFAGFLSHTDDQIGRLLAHLEASGDADNTIVVLVSDNGASSEGGVTGSINDVRLVNRDPAGRAEMRERIDELGGPSLHNNYPWGWTMAGNTPFKRWKREVHEGGVADPCIVRWPARFAGEAGAIRHQFTHAIDVMPTVLDLIGVQVPDRIRGQEQSPIHGASFANLFAEGGADAPAQRTTQHFEMLGSRALYQDGWKAVTFKPLGPITADTSSNTFMAPFDDDVWELYQVEVDPSEVHDLAADEPERLASMIEQWWEEAARFNVLPLDNRILFTILNPPPNKILDRNRYRYVPYGAPVPQSIAVDVRNRTHEITASVDVADGTTSDGVLLAMGCVLGGWSFQVHDGRLRYLHNLYGKTVDVIESDRVIGAGAHTLGFRYEKLDDEGGRAELVVDGDVVGEGLIAKFTPTSYNNTGAGLSCGYELGPSVGPGYEAPFRWNSELRDVVVEVTGEPRVDPLKEFERIMTEQ
ncbi:MAG TPA: arylsulfatase [Acidimicrobiia bacterium]